MLHRCVNTWHCSISTQDSHQSFLVYGSLNLKQPISWPKIVRVCYTRVFVSELDQSFECTQLHNYIIYARFRSCRTSFRYTMLDTLLCTEKARVSNAIMTFFPHRPRPTWREGTPSDFHYCLYPPSQPVQWEPWGWRRQVRSSRSPWPCSRWAQCSETAPMYPPPFPSWRHWHCSLWADTWTLVSFPNLRPWT